MFRSAHAAISRIGKLFACVKYAPLIAPQPTTPTLTFSGMDNVFLREAADDRPNVRRKLRRAAVHPALPHLGVSVLEMAHEARAFEEGRGTEPLAHRSAEVVDALDIARERGGDL